MIIKKDLLVLGIGPKQGLEHTLTAERMYSINFTVTKKKFCLSLLDIGVNSYLFVNGTEIYKFKSKDSEIVPSSLCLGNISKDWSVEKNWKKLDLLAMFIILVWIIMLLQLMILKIFISIWWKKIIWYDKYVHIPKKVIHKNVCIY